MEYQEIRYKGGVVNYVCYRHNLYFRKREDADLHVEIAHRSGGIRNERNDAHNGRFSRFFPAGYSIKWSKG